MIGTATGEIINLFIPQTSNFYQFFTLKINPEWKISNFDIIILNLSLSLKFNINPFTLIGFIVGSIFSFKKV